MEQLNGLNDHIPPGPGMAQDIVGTVWHLAGGRLAIPCQGRSTGASVKIIIQMKMSKHPLSSFSAGSKNCSSPIRYFIKIKLRRQYVRSKGGEYKHISASCSAKEFSEEGIKPCRGSKKY